MGSNPIGPTTLAITRTAQSPQLLAVDLRGRALGSLEDGDGAGDLGRVQGAGGVADRQFLPLHGRVAGRHGLRPVPHALLLPDFAGAGGADLLWGGRRRVTDACS